MRECPKCKKPMKNLGNVNCLTYTTDPPQWDDVYVCDACKTKEVVRVHGSIYDPTGGRDLDNYTTVTATN